MISLFMHVCIEFQCELRKNFLVRELPSHYPATNGPHSYVTMAWTVDTIVDIRVSYEALISMIHLQMNQSLTAESRERYTHSYETLAMRISNAISVATLLVMRIDTYVEICYFLDRPEDDIVTLVRQSHVNSKLLLLRCGHSRKKE